MYRKPRTCCRHDRLPRKAAEKLGHRLAGRLAEMSQSAMSKAELPRTRTACGS
jgi:hypothetical protein